MAFILSIETATSVCSVCLSADGKIIDCRENVTDNSHAKMLTVFIEEILADNAIAFTDLSSIAVSAGPGSYTGLRIGTSVAKGLCYALNIPLIAVPTLQCLALAIQQHSDKPEAVYLPVLDARRIDVYTAIYNHGLTELVPAGCVTVNTDFETSLSKFRRVYIGGNGMQKCKEVFSAANLIFVDGIACDSRAMVPVAHQKFIKKEFENMAYFEPVYLKEFPAKTKH